MKVVAPGEEVILERTPPAPVPSSYEAPEFRTEDLLPGSANPALLRRLGLPVYTQQVTSGTERLQVGVPEPPAKSAQQPEIEPSAAAEALSVVEGSAFKAQTHEASAQNAPVGMPDAYKARAGATLSIAAPGFLMNDIDPDGETLTATALLDSPDHGSLSAFPDGSFTYTPNAGFTGTDSFVYRMRDASNNFADPVTVTIEVIEGNRIPRGTNDAYKALAGATLSIAAPGFLSNDIDPDGEALTATALLDSPDHGSLSAFPDGSFTYTPNAGFTGTDSFVYRMRDASNNFADPVTVTIEVIEGNRAPRGTEDLFAVVMNTPRTVAAPGFLSNDIDPDGEALTATALLDSPDHGSLSAFPDGSFTYTPNGGFTGTDSFVYRMRDASNNFADPVTVRLLVFDPNAPVIIPPPLACLDPATGPSYAGGYVLNAAQTRAFVRVDVPQGGTVFEFYNTNNLVVGAPEGGPETNAALPGVTRVGDTFTFAPFSPATVFFPIARAGSSSGVSFFLRVTDTCGRIVDVDPSFALETAGGEAYAFGLDANAPNPFSNETWLPFTLTEAGPARLVLYDLLGREVAVLLDAPVEAGPQRIRLDGSAWPAGQYVVRLTAGTYSATRILSLVR